MSCRLGTAVRPMVRAAEGFHAVPCLPVARCLLRVPCLLSIPYCLPRGFNNALPTALLAHDTVIIATRAPCAKLSCALIAIAFCYGLTEQPRARHNQLAHQAKHKRCQGRYWSACGYCRTQRTRQTRPCP